ncbi:uncharacterized protein PRCAT00003602001 [Priceomyces carsonii]|uniref:uncharacterized protein n=1 Tax=Priceomyces carsonii TaxID=28549 RepID=UPI002ED904D3|nr:unnamed protein product [Priceomyces carsonii]
MIDNRLSVSLQLEGHGREQEHRKTQDGSRASDNSSNSEITSENHRRQYLESASLYRKFKLAIIPPLQNSFSFLNSGIVSPAEEYLGSEKHEELNVESASNEEDDDIASAIDGLRVLNYFFSLLTTSMCSGLGSPPVMNSEKEDEGVRKDFNKGESWLSYGAFEESSDSESETKSGSNSSENNIQHNSELIENESNPLNLRTLRNSKGSHKSKVRDVSSSSSIPYPQNSSTLSLTNSKSDSNIGDASLHENMNTHVSLSDEMSSNRNLVKGSHLQSDLLSKFTPFQESILKNLDPHWIEEGILIKLKEDYSTIESQEAQKKKNALRIKIANKLQRVFELSNNDYFYGNFSAWLIKDVLLQGHLYLTRDSLLFFAFLPDRYITNNSDEGGYNQDDSDLVIQSGSLGLKTAQYGDSMFSTVITHRYWATLRSDTLAIYNSSTDLYFPSIVIDLRSCVKVEIIDKPQPNKQVSAAVTSPRLSRRNSSDISNWTDDESEIASILGQESSDENIDELTDGIWFQLVSKKKTYKFHADNLFTARQWCNNLTKLIFQLHNANSKNEVLIKIPIENIVSFERNGILKDDACDNNQDEDPALTLSIKYLETEEIQSASASRLKKTFSKRTKKTSVIDSLSMDHQVGEIYFLFFNNGERLYKQFHDIVYKNHGYEHNEKMEGEVKHENFIDKARKMAKKHSFQDQKNIARNISTLLRNGTTNGLVSQVTQPKALTTNNSSPTSPNSSTLLQDSGIKRLGKNLSHPSSFFVKKSDEGSVEYLKKISSSPLLSEDLHQSKDGVPTFLSDYQHINLPRPLSVSGLKNLQMSFETTQRKLEDANTRYTDGKNEPEDASNDSSKNDCTSKRLESDRIDTQMFPSPLILSDPTDVEVQSKSGQNKLKNLGKHLKALSQVSSMWTGHPNHFQAVFEGDPYYIQEKSTREESLEHYRSHFTLRNDKILVASYYAHLRRSIPVYGKLYLGNDELCFRSLLPGVLTKMILPLRDIENCYKEKGMKFTYSGLVIVIRGHEEIFLEFSSQKARDDCELLILRELERIHGNDSWTPQPHDWGDNYSFGLDNLRMDHSMSVSGSYDDLDIKLASSRIENARLKLFEDKVNAAAGLDVPIILEDSPFFKTEIRPSTSYNFTLLTIGSRGDVQPYIALGKGLIAEGHNVTIATHKEFEGWIKGHNMSFKEIAGNPAELMSLMVTHGSMSVAFVKEASSKFRGWINDLLISSWIACQDTEILIESPSAMGGIHIAEALGIPYMRAFTMPWTKTRAYPHAFIVPDQKKGGSYNYLTHVMFETIFWKGTSSQVNKWRVEQLDLPKTNLSRLQQSKIPFLYNVSPTIFPPSVDFPDWVKVTGYWFLDEGSAKDYSPPQKLVEFLKTAREDRKRVVYIGFGSIVVNDAKSLTKAIVEAVVSADVRCILNKGWSDRLTDKDKSEPEIELPMDIFNSGSIPHDWLFPRIDAAVHHGGSGTTGATLRAGLPTVIKPFFGDQFFYASRIEDVGAGICLKKLNSRSLSKALKTVTTDLRIIEKSKKISEKVKREHGVMSAIETIYSELEYSRNLILAKQQYNENYKNTHSNMRSGATTPGAHTPLIFIDEDGNESDEFKNQRDRLAYSSDDDDDDDDSDVDDDDNDDNDDNGNDDDVVDIEATEKR